jgi:hypothetical protein
VILIFEYIQATTRESYNARPHFGDEYGSDLISCISNGGVVAILEIREYKVRLLNFENNYFVYRLKLEV